MIPLQPGVAGGTLKIEDLSKSVMERFASNRQLTPEATVADLLTQEDIFIYFKRKESDGTLSFFTNSADIKSGTYEVTFQWVRYEPIYVEGRTIYYGVGATFSGSVSVKKASLLAQLGELIFGASSKSVTGSIKASRMGIVGPPVENIISPTSGEEELTEKTITTYMLNFAKVLALVRANGVILAPRILFTDQKTATELGVKVKPQQ